MNIDDETPGWPEVDRLISEQKFEAAARVVGELRAAARRAGDEAESTRALVKEVQLRTALHGYETAVRFLREEPRPAGPRHRAVLELFYAQTLMSYFHAYSWEINQRERVETGAEVDLKSWTREQISTQAHRGYQAVWAEREAWGGESIGTLAEYFDQNDYPPRIRGTLRDAVTYLWVELLGNTALWRPEQSNELFRLEAERLIAGDAAASAAVELADPAVHPLVKIGAILDDLELWHRRHDRPEAAFEARLERLRRLRTSLSDEQDRRAIRRDLEEHLDDLGRRYEWWSMGMATLAELVRDANAPDSLVKARRIALEGERAHPESIGGRRCRHLVAAIERPSYQLAAMASDGAARRSIRVTHSNLPALHFRAYALDLIAAVEGAEDYNLLPSHREVPPIIAGRRPAAEWSVELPATPDHRTHHTYVTPPLERAGLYLVVASARRDFAEPFNQQVAINFILTDLVLLRRSDDAATEVTVRSGASGRPAPGVRVGLYRYDWRAGHRQVAEKTVGEAGVVRFEGGKTTRERYFLVARRGDDVALDQSYFAPRPRGQAEERTAALVYTDRSVYRPRQKIFWKVVAYRGGGDDSRFATLPETSLTVELRDPNHEVVATAEVRTNRFGSAAGEFEIPTGRLLGGWQVRATLGGAAGIRVEEYKRPTFEVTIEDPEAPLRLNRPATLGGEVRYYFGLPVVSGTVDWRVTREPVFPRWWWWFGRPTAPVQTIAAGTAELDADGKFRIT
ncbi:MAG: hypothetical protein GY856_36595, partial [bacterium]|nr:hypothetical protein [bacterium]